MFFPIGLIGLIGLIMPIGLIALGVLREKHIGSLGAASRLGAPLRGSSPFVGVPGVRAAALGGRSSPDGGGAGGTGLATLGGIWDFSHTLDVSPTGQHPRPPPDEQLQCFQPCCRKIVARVTGELELLQMA